MPHLRPYAPKDWSRFLELELETQLDSLGDSTEEERDIFKERFTAPQDMVALVSAIASYARSSNQDFVVIGQNSEALLTDESYRTALDAVSKESLLFGLGGEGLENTPEQIAWSERLLREGSAAGLHVFAIEYLSDPERIEEARRRLLQLGFTPFFGHRLLDRLPE